MIPSDYLFLVRLKHGGGVFVDFQDVAWGERATPALQPAGLASLCSFMDWLDGEAHDARGYTLSSDGTTPRALHEALTTATTNGEGGAIASFKFMGIIPDEEPEEDVPPGSDGLTGTWFTKEELYTPPEEAPYGYCPVCGAPGVSRERRLGGNTKCKNEHVFPSRDAVLESAGDWVNAIRLAKSLSELRDAFMAVFAMHFPGDISFQEENQRRGEEAIERMLQSKEDEPDAMFRPGFGGISFYYGKPGSGVKYKHGGGISHIVAKHGVGAARMMPSVIARGEIGKVQRAASGDRAMIHFAGHTAILSLYYNKVRKTWLVTGWEDDASGSCGEGCDSSADTHHDPIHSRAMVGAKASSPEQIGTPDEEVNAGGGEFVLRQGRAEKKTSGILEGALDEAAKECATHQDNKGSHPTEEQLRAGNYKKGSVRIGGLEISLENPAGSVRSGTGADGTRWETEMQDHYGYVKGSVGRDKDHVDVFISPDVEAEDIPGLPVFVVDQVVDGSFDEHKVILGQPDADAARIAYLSNYEPGWDGLGAMTEMTWEAFKAWCMNPMATKHPLAWSPV